MAKAIKHGLGRGLEALLGAEPLPEETGALGPAVDAVVRVKIAQIDPNRRQPRKNFDEEALRELADSIANVGVLQPILVCRNGERYTIIAGERRWRAARLAGLNEIPALVREFDEVQRLEVALIENLQRDDLNPVEEALGVRKLMEDCGYTQETVSKRLGKSRPAVANLLRILTLPEAVLALVIEGKLSAGHARALAALKSPEAQLKLANFAVAQGWSVRQLERICANEQAQAEEKPKPARPKRDPELNELERMAREVFGTRARLEGDAQKGKLVLQYMSADDLERIWEILECIRQGNS